LTFYYQAVLLRRVFFDKLAMGDGGGALATGKVFASTCWREGGMSKKRTAPSTPKALGAVSLERAARLYRLIKFLGTGSKTRAAILQRLRVDIRTFYRDLEMLRDYHIEVELKKRKYTLEDDAGSALERLPLPDPGLCLGEAIILAKGRTRVHQKLRKLLAQIME
jgi:hypothetical protein